MRQVQAREISPVRAPGAEKFARREGYEPEQLYWWRWTLRADGPSKFSPSPEETRFLPVHRARAGRQTTSALRVSAPISYDALREPLRGAAEARIMERQSEPGAMLPTNLRRAKTAADVLC